MTKHQRLLLFGSSVLFMIALILIILTQMTRLPEKQVLIEAHPELSWQPFPTRVPAFTATPALSELYTSFQNAVLARDFDTAQMSLHKANDIYTNEAFVLMANARLAYMQGQSLAAEKYIWQAIGTDKTNAKMWALAGLILTQNKKLDTASQAYAIAAELDPNLEPVFFQERWRIAVDKNDPDLITELADSYYLFTQDDPMADYYAATALLQSGSPMIALNLLNSRLQSTPNSPAILWFTLGHIYLDQGFYTESVVVLEHTKSLISAGDQSIASITGDVEHVIDEALAAAYLGSQRCVSAEILYQRLASVTAEGQYAVEIQKAVDCQTPTPTPTHWMISQQ
ncbi:MAG: hypothetical protein P1S60_08060 [Anaerolineae bacterium]|nr:hypothetical protein [Anaerolineae bacterium]